MKRRTIDQKGHGFYRKSKAFGLVSGIALGTMLALDTTSVSADVVNVYTGPKATTEPTTAVQATPEVTTLAVEVPVSEGVTTSFVDTATPAAAPEATVEAPVIEVIKVETSKDVTKFDLKGVEANTVVDWESGEVNVPAERSHTDKLTMTTPINKGEVVNVEKTTEKSKALGYLTEVGKDEITFTLDKEGLDKLNKKNYVETKGEMNLELKAVRTNHLRDAKETRPVVVDEEYTATRLVDKQITVEEIEYYDEKVTKTVEVEETINEDVEETYTEKVTKTRQVPKTTSTTVTDYTSSALNLGYILDTSNSRKEVIAPATETLNKFLGTLDKSKINVYAEDYAYDYVSTGTGLSSGWVFAGNTIKVGGGASTLNHIYNKTGTPLTRANSIIEALKAANGSAETVLVIESDFDDFGGFSSRGTTDFFKGGQNLDDLPAGVKLLLIEDVEKNLDKGQATPELEELVAGKVWRVASKKVDGSFYDRNEILDTFMKKAVPVTVETTVMVDETYEEEVTKTRTVSKPKTVKVSKPVEETVRLSRVIQVPKTIKVPEEYTATRKVTVNREFDIKQAYSVVEPITITPTVDKGVTVKKLIIKRDNDVIKEVTGADASKPFTFTPTLEGTYQLVVEYSHDGVASGGLVVTAESKDFETKREVFKVSDNREFRENFYYDTVKLPMPLVISKLTEPASEYKRSWKIVANEGTDKEYHLEKAEGTVLTAPLRVESKKEQVRQTPSRVEKAKTQNQTKSQEVKTLPNTGEASSVLAALGLISTGFGLVGIKKKEK